MATYIHPLDLLNLARTWGSLRQLLMDKYSAFVWKAARSQVAGLPDCPADLTEPEYANLVFYARCHVCSNPANDLITLTSDTGLWKTFQDSSLGYASQALLGLQNCSV